MAISALTKKLQLKAGYRMLILSAPADYETTLEPLPDGVSISTKTDGTPFDAIHLFVTCGAGLAEQVPAVLAALKPDGLLWISYPKKASGIETDLTRDVGWQSITEAGWRPIRQISIDSTWSALRFRPVEHRTEVDAVAAQYSGAKAHLRPILDKIIAAAEGFGPDVKQNVRKTYVALARRKQFANIVPSTRSRVDLVLKLPDVENADVEDGGRLMPAGNVGSGSMTHRIALASADEVDAEALEWLKAAYDAVG